MERNESEVVKYIEPVFHFCVIRLNNRHDAEDLASEIMVHILNGIRKYHTTMSIMMAVLNGFLITK